MRGCMKVWLNKWLVRSLAGMAFSEKVVRLWLASVVMVKGLSGCTYRNLMNSLSSNSII